jgi:hypothetical protein
LANRAIFHLSCALRLHCCTCCSCCSSILACTFFTLLWLRFRAVASTVHCQTSTRQSLRCNR